MDSLELIRLRSRSQSPGLLRWNIQIWKQNNNGHVATLELQIFVTIVFTETQNYADERSFICCQQSLVAKVNSLVSSRNENLA